MFNLAHETNTEKVGIPFRGTDINITFAGFDAELNVEEYTTIDYGNLYGEILTISTLINRVGIWKAEAEEQYDLQKLEVGRYEAELSEIKRRTLTTVVGDKTKFPSNDMVNQAVANDSVVINHKKKMYRLKKYHAILDAFYWGVQNKSTKLNKLSENLSLTPTDFEQNIIEGKVNGYVIKRSKSILTQKK